ncbi:MAG: hypothetical protein R2769_08180 [Saprospiraceae bacterium]
MEYRLIFTDSAAAILVDGETTAAAQEECLQGRKIQQIFLQMLFSIAKPQGSRNQPSPG